MVSTTQQPAVDLVAPIWFFPLLLFSNPVVPHVLMTTTTMTMMMKMIRLVKTGPDTGVYIPERTVHDFPPCSQSSGSPLSPSSRVWVMNASEIRLRHVSFGVFVGVVNRLRIRPPRPLEAVRAGHTVRARLAHPWAPSPRADPVDPAGP